MLTGPLIHTCTIQLRDKLGEDSNHTPVYAWIDEQEDVACRLFRPSLRSMGKAVTGLPGEEVLMDLTAMFAPTVTLTEHERQIVTSESGYAGTYSIVKVRPVSGRSSIHHYECDLQKTDAADVATIVDGGAAATVFHAFLDGGNA